MAWSVKLQDLYPLLRHMADGEFHSGEALADQLGLTRAAIWKRMRALEQLPGIHLEAVRGKGYRLGAPLELLDENKLLQRLSATNQACLIGFDLLLETASTNDWLRDRPLSPMGTGRVCLAEYQHAGKGRRGRHWVSSFGTNIYLSLAWRFDLSMADLAGLSLAAGTAVCRVLESHGLEEHGLKWPNDIYLGGRKLGGILVEASGEMEGPSHAILGVGLNLRLQEEVAGQIDQPWTDMARTMEVLPDRNALCGDLLDALMSTCRQYAESGLGDFLKSWKKYDLYLDTKVTLHVGNQALSGIYRGLDDRGGLILETSQGCRTWYAGEVTLRGNVSE